MKIENTALLLGWVVVTVVGCGPVDTGDEDCAASGTRLRPGR